MKKLFWLLTVVALCALSGGASARNADTLACVKENQANLGARMIYQGERIAIATNGGTRELVARANDGLWRLCARALAAEKTGATTTERAPVVTPAAPSPASPTPTAAFAWPSREVTLLSRAFAAGQAARLAELYELARRTTLAEQTLAAGHEDAAPETRIDTPTAAQAPAALPKSDADLDRVFTVTFFVVLTSLVMLLFWKQLSEWCREFPRKLTRLYWRMAWRMRAIKDAQPARVASSKPRSGIVHQRSVWPGRVSPRYRDAAAPAPGD
jgi:hypothetical protein